MLIEKHKNELLTLLISMMNKKTKLWKNTAIIDPVLFVWYLFTSPSRQTGYCITTTDRQDLYN